MTTDYITLKDDGGAEKVYAAYRTEGVVLTSINLENMSNVAFYLPYDQLKKVYKGMYIDKSCGTE